MKKKNIPSVPTIDIVSTIKRIEQKVVKLTEEEIAHITKIIQFHEVETSACAERISQYLDVSYKSIYELL